MKKLAGSGAAGTCGIRVGEGYFRKDCGRPVPEGEDVCKLHLEVRRRANEREAKLRAKHAEWSARAGRNDNLAAEIAKLLDGQATVGFTSTHILLTPEAAELLIKKLTTAQKGGG